MTRHRIHIAIAAPPAVAFLPQWPKIRRFLGEPAALAVEPRAAFGKV
jgi:hypothetical protein